MAHYIYKFITSLRLTVVLLVFGFLLVFLGTVAQEPLGLYTAQAEYFRSFFISWPSFYAGMHKAVDMLCQGMGFTLGPVLPEHLAAMPKVPVFPGGYLIGTALLVNLFAAHLRYYQPGTRKIGIALIHLGVVMLLVGQLLTDVLSVETVMHLRNGETKNYTESSRQFELAVVDMSDPRFDKVVAIDARSLVAGKEIGHAELPFDIRVKEAYVNSSISQQQEPGFSQVSTSAGFGRGVWWRELPQVTEMDRRNMPSAIVEIVNGQESVGSYLVSVFIQQPQLFQTGGRVYRMEMRLARFYKPFNIHLVEFRHDKYPGTDIPKNFSSRVRVLRPETGEDREVLIYMNNPLRYEGETFYQASFDPDNQGTILQVVRNPSWVTPYLACVIVGIGMSYHFLMHLIGFVRKRNAS
jgi:hypothetical protein